MKLPAVGLCLLGFSGCTSGNASAGDTPELFQGSREQMIDVSVTTDRSDYAAGEPVRLTLLVANDSTAAVAFDFPSGQRYDFTILSASGESVWQWSAGMSFIQMMGRETLEVGASLRYTEQYVGELAAGTYTVVGKLAVLGRSLDGSATFTVR